MRQSIKLVLVPSQQKDERQKARYELDEDEGCLRVFDQSKVQLQEVLPHLIKPKRAYKHFCTGKQLGNVSWKALSETKHRTRSIDDIRNFWMLKVLPILETYGSKKRKRSDSSAGILLDAERWCEADDISLLEAVEAQEIMDADDPIDFNPDSMGNQRSREANEARWHLLLKGLCALMPGKRFNPSETARKMIEDIKTQPERYVSWAVPKTVAVKRQRTGLNHYVNIHDYYKEHFGK